MVARRGISVLALVTGFALVFSDLAVAGFVPAVSAAVSSTSATISNPPQGDNDPYSSFISNAHGSASATIITSPFVSVTATATALDALLSPAFLATAHLDYHFVVVGGTPGTYVPILISTNLTSSGLYPSVATASIGVTTDPYGPSQAGVGQTVNGGPDPNHPTSFSGTLHLDVATGADNLVDLYVEAGNGVHQIGVFSASADPHIFVDPTFPNAAEYSVVLSDGVGNGLSANVPEPSTIIMLSTLIPAFLAGWFMRSGRRVA
jgi:hypothetical protein